MRCEIYSDPTTQQPQLIRDLILLSPSMRSDSQLSQSQGTAVVSTEVGFGSGQQPPQIQTDRQGERETIVLSARQQVSCLAGRGNQNIQLLGRNYVALTVTVLTVQCADRNMFDGVN